MTKNEICRMTDAELYERLKRISVMVQCVRFQQGRESYYAAKRWASLENKPIRQELRRRQANLDLEDWAIKERDARDEKEQRRRPF